MDSNYKFGLNSIIKMGENLTKELHESGVTVKAELCVYVDDASFKKTDEDLYYRLGNGEEYVPSDNEIDVNFELLTIKIKKKDEE